MLSVMNGKRKDGINWVKVNGDWMPLIHMAYLLEGPNPKLKKRA